MIIAILDNLFDMWFGLIELMERVICIPWILHFIIALSLLYDMLFRRTQWVVFVLASIQGVVIY